MSVCPPLPRPLTRVGASRFELAPTIGSVLSAGVHLVG